jgi:hypothetical protein
MSFIDTSATVFIAVATGLAAVAATASVIAARRSNQTANTVAAIERDRRHTELAPRLTLTSSSRTELNQTLTVRFDSPAALRHLDNVRVSIRDDRDRTRGPKLAGMMTTEEIQQVIWGPLRFRPGIAGADKLGRAVAPFPLELGATETLTLEAAMPPTSMKDTATRENWLQDHRDQPLRLWIECSTGDHQPWKFTCDLPAAGGTVQTQWT